MPFSPSITQRARNAGITAFASAALLSGAALAQEATPAGTPLPPSEGYPVAIHQGTCEDHNVTPAHELENAVTFGTHGGRSPESVGIASVTTTLYTSTGTFQDSIDNLATEGHVVAIHESGEDSETILACGAIAGFADDGELGVALSSTEGNSVVGVAVLDEDDGEIEATVYLFDTAAAETATPEPGS